MADQTIKTLHPFLQENSTKVSSNVTIKSYSHDNGDHTKPIFCMVHGWPQSSYMWRHIIPSLVASNKNISLFIPELPGYGLSSLPPKHDKRTVGNLIVEALQKTFPNGTSRPIIWCGHDRGARIAHRLLVDSNPQHNILSAIIIDIVPTLAQWTAFSSPTASAAYYHWPFLATPQAPQMIEAMGAGVWTKLNLERTKGSNPEGAARFLESDAIGHYCHQFGSNPKSVAGACGDYAAGAFEDVEEQKRDMEEGRLVPNGKVPLMVIWSAGNLGRMHDVRKVWEEWVERPEEVRFEGIEGGFGHYLPEECPERLVGLFEEWIEKSSGGK